MFGPCSVAEEGEASVDGCAEGLLDEDVEARREELLGYGDVGVVGGADDGGIRFVVNVNGCEHGGDGGEVSRLKLRGCGRTAGSRVDEGDELC